VTHKKGSGPQFGESVYISVKLMEPWVKFNAWVANNKNFDPERTFFSGAATEDSAPNSVFQTSGIIRNESSYEAHIQAAG